MRKFLRLLVTLALFMVPWVTMGQNAKVSEYDGSSTTASYSTIASTTTAHALSGGYADITMPFAMYFGETQVPQNSTLRVWDDGSVTFEGIAALADARIAPLYLDGGYTTTQVYSSGNSNLLTVEWRKVVSGTSSYSFQLKLYPGGDVEFCYGPMTINSSINVMVGMMSSANDIYRVGGANGGSDWSDITRYTSGTTTRTLSTAYHPEYNTTTNQGMVYTFTQPACVKPTGISAEATAWNTIKVDWTVSSTGNGYEVKYSTDANFDPSTEGTSKTVNSGTTLTTNLTGLSGSTTYYMYVRKLCSGAQSGWTEKTSATTPNGCPDPTDLAVTSTGVVTWTGIANASAYEVKYGVGDFDPYTEGTLINGITATTTTIPTANITPLTTVNVYLRAHCSSVNNAYTDWVGPVYFTTPCALETIPYSESFESYTGTTYNTAGTQPTCWLIYSNGTNNAYIPHVTGSGSYWYPANGTTNCLAMTSGSATYGDTKVVALPQFSTALNQTQITFSSRMESTTSGTLTLGYLTSDDPASYVSVYTISNTAEVTEHEYMLNNFPATATRIAFRWYYASSFYSCCIDEITVEAIPTCLRPTITGVTSEGLVSWTAIDGATSYEVVCVPTGNDMATGTVVSAGTGTSYQLTGLQSATTYDVYLRSRCSATDTSKWSLAYTFTSACVRMAVPYSEDFTNYSGFASTSYPYYGPSVLPLCWDIYSNGTNTASTSGSSSYFGGVWKYSSTSYGSMQANNNYLCMPIYIISTSTTNSTYVNYHTQRGDTKYAVFPEFIQPLSSLMVSFNYKISTANSATGAYSVLELGYITDNDVNTFETMQTYEGTSNTTQAVSELTLATLAASAPEGARLAFKYSGHHNGTSTTSYTTVYCGIDNVFVEQIPTCFKPTITYISYNGLVNWTAVDGAASYELVCVPTGDDVATGTVINAGTGTSYQMTGLTPATTYDVYLRSRCSATDASVWSFAYTYTTPCAPVALPYSEDFEAYGSGVANPIDMCWRKGTNSATAYPYPYSSNAITGSRSLYFYAYRPSSATSTAYYSYAALPKFNATMNTLQLSFKMRRYNSTSANYTSRVVVGVMTDAIDIATFIPVDTIDLKNEATLSIHDIDVSFAGYTGPDGCIAIYDEVPPLYGTSTTSYSYAYIDDIYVDVIPTCAVPNNLVASNVTATAATLAWNERAASTQWEVKVGPQGFNPDEAGMSTIVNTTPTVTVEYLEAANNYDAYVRAICNPEGPTEWSNPVSFSTSGYPCISYGTPGPEQATIIGEGTTTNNYLPCYNYYNYSFTEQIYTAAEIGGAGVINSIAFYNDGAEKTRNIEVYLVETSKESFSGSTDWVSVTESQRYYSGSHTFTVGDWSIITLTTPFSYSGSGNLMVVIDDNTGSYTSSPHGAYRVSNVASKALRIYSDGTNYDPASPSSYSGTVMSVRNNIRLGIQYASCNTGRCMPPQVDITFSDVEYEATLTFTNANEDVTNPSYGIIWGQTGFNPKTAGTSVSPITTSTYTLTNLTMLTDYDVYVYAICGSGEVDTVRYSFTSQFIPNCKVPVLSESGYGASNITYNTADLTWRQPGDTPLYWTVRYADADFDPATAAAGDYTEMTVQGTAGASAQLTGLVAGNTYFVYVKAVCVESPLDESAWSAVYTFNALTCDVPTGFAVSDVTNSTAMLSWNNVAGLQGWTIAYGTEDDFTNNTYTVVTSETNTKELTGLAPYTTYYAFVCANCTPTDNSNWTNYITFRTTCPDGGDVTMGDHTGTNSYLPYYAYYNYSLSEQIYTAAEMGGAKELTSFSYEVVSTAPSRDVVIYLGETTLSSFTSVSDAIPLTGLTQVYSGNMDGATGWHTITFDTPFDYSGAGNLVVVVDRPYTDYTNGGSFGVIATTTPQALYGYDDNTDVTPENISTVSYKNVLSVKNNFIFPAPCNTSVTCFAPASVSTEITPANVVTVNWTHRTDLRPIVDNYELKYGLAGFDPDNAGTLVSDLNNVFTYTINEQLASGADYDVYVRTVCGENEHSSWTKGSFTTYPTCWVPTNITSGAATQTSLTLGWTENTPTPATRWQVAYGEPGFDPDNTAKANYVETTNNIDYALVNLHHSTTYDIYVRTVCSATDYSDWSTKITASTACGTWTIADLPLTEDFESVSAYNLPLCWEYAVDGAGYSYNYYDPYNGSYILYFPAETDSDIVAMPAMDIHDTVCVLTFYTRPESYSNSSCGTFSVGYITNLNDNSTFVPVETYNYSDWTSNTYEYKEVLLEHIPAGSRPAFLHLTTSSNWYWFVDDVTLKLREEVNVLPNNGGTIEACSEFIMLDTVNGTYANNLNATYIVKSATAGKVVRLSGEYDMENGYDYISIYRGAQNAANLIGTYTGMGSVNLMTSSNQWVDSGYFTIVVTSDDDNALNYTGFKFLVSCECPNPDPIVYPEIVNVNGSYTWRNGTTYNNNVVHTYSDYNPDEVGLIEPDFLKTAEYTYVNVARCDSVNYSLDLTIHPTYTLTYNKTICEREEVNFYGEVKTTTNTYTVPMQSQFGADSIGILVLQVNPAPSADIYNGGRVVTEIADFCDNADLTLLARSDVNNATYVWDDESTNATRIVNPHTSNTYTVVATNPTTGCTSLPATVTVTTTPVPALSISGDAEICAGQSTTLTLADANNVPATYRWSTGATTTSITVSPTETTTYTVTATTSNASACPATAEFTVTVNQLPVVAATASVSQICRDSLVTLTATAVEGLTYSWNTGATTAVATTAAASTGVYTVTVTDQKGCVNQFNTANVTVYPSYEVTTDMSVCYTQNPYTWEGMTISANGTYNQMLQTRTPGRPMQCDSLVHLTFTFEEMGVENNSIELCYGDSYTFNNNTYTATVDTNLSYIDNSGDCPVQYNLAVTVNPVKATTLEQTVCDSYTWPVSGETYTVSGAYPVTLATSKGCDSVVTMNLTVNYQNTGVETVTACDNYVWALNGVNYTASTNVPTFTLQNQWGCDSVVTLNLTVNYRTYHEDFHCVSDARTYTWIDGQTYRLNVNVEDGIEWVTGENAVGCNEIAQLHLIMNPVLDSLAWVDVEACDEYVINNEVVVNQENCEGVVGPRYLRESGDYMIRTRAADDHDQMTRIHLTINQSTYHTTIANECLPYTWTITGENGLPFEVATITADMVNGAAVYNTSVDLAEAGFVTSTCSSIEVLRLTPKYPTFEVTNVDTICTNSSWTADNGTVFSGANNTTGIYTWDNSTLNAAGCPLNKQVNLTVNPAYTNATKEMAFCESDFVLNETTGEYEHTVADDNHDGADVVLTIPGNLNEMAYTNTIYAYWHTAQGCDSTVAITYTVTPTIHAEVDAVACYEYTWDLNRETYRIADGANQTHSYVTTADNGCDLVTTLNLTLNDTARGYVDSVVCVSYEYDGVTYLTDKTFVEVYDGDEPILNGCDSVTYISFHIHQTELIHQYVVANSPYKWRNGQTYDQSVENIYFDEPSEGDCGNVYSLHLTMVDPIAFCENAFPYQVGINGITISAEDTINQVLPFVWSNNDLQGNDTILYYTVNNTYNIPESAEECDSYTWQNDTYTESGSYAKSYTSTEGCDSVYTLDLTIKNSTTATVEATICDSYTWTDGDGQTYTTSGNYTYTTTNTVGCDSVVTLALTINKNNGAEVTVSNGCDSYTWTDGNGQTYNTSGDYSFQYTDANGCVGDSVLHLTINPSYETYSTKVVNEGGSYTYLGVMYTAPYDDTITHTYQSVDGCDSINHLHLIIPVIDDNNIVEVNVQACGTYTWSIAGVDHTYQWIPMSERQSHGMAMYKDITANKYVYTYPTDTIYDVNGAMTGVNVLHLNLLESTTSTDTVNVPVSLGSYIIYGVADTIAGVALDSITFTASNIGTPIVKTVGVGSVAYCNDYRTFTFNIINNYDTTEAYVCADATTYEWNSETYTIGEPGHTYYFTQKDNEGTLNELAHVRKVNQRAVNTETITETACDTYTWTAGNGETYTSSVSDVVYNYTDANECPATKTLNLTINNNSNTTYTVDECDTYTWTTANGGNGNAYTESGEYTYNYNAANGCPSVNTLNLTIRNNSNQTFTKAECVTYTWTTEDGGDGRVLTESGVVTYEYTAINGCPSVNTLNLTINQPGNTAYTEAACDSMEWNGTKYYASGTYFYNYNTAAGCASVDTLYLTVNNATHNSETLTQCDSYTWNGTAYAESGVYTYGYTDANSCPSVDTLHLTINVNTTGVEDTVIECDEYKWTLNYNRLYTTSGDYTCRTTDSNGCGTTNTLHLTINHTSSYDSVLYISDGSYRYYGQNATELFGEGVYNRSELYTNAAGCDSTLNITFNVGTSLLGIDNVVNCSEYTWRNGETYVWISDEERNAHLNGDNVAPLYKTSTGTYIYYNPTFTVERDNAFDSIYMLALTLTQSYIGNAEVTINVSEGSYVYRDTTYYFAEAAAQKQEFVNDDIEVEYHFDTALYCEGIINITIHLVNNYQEVVADAADICVTETSYTWRGHTISTVTNDYDHPHTYYVYDDINADGIIEYITVNQHPLIYATERRTACDSYTWNDVTYTESTSHATAFFPAGTVIDGHTLICDSTVTLILTINHNTSTTTPVNACEEYTWLAANGGNGETYTVSGTYTRDYLTAQGCPSTNTLELTVNYNTSTEYTVDECDSYTWTAEDGGNGLTYTASSTAEGYTYSYNTAEGCPSVNTLHLTIRNNSNESFNKTVCDTYTWTAAEGGAGETYTTSGIYTYDYEAANGCPSTNTLNLTVNQNSGHTDDIVVCDSALWHGTWYYADNNTATYDYADANNCPSIDTLNLTVNASTHNVETVVACQTYTWENNGSTIVLTESGVYTNEYDNIYGCQSADTLHLTIGAGRTFGTQTVVTCGPYTWVVNDEVVATIDESVETSTSFLNPRTGCDSVVFLYLTVNPQTVTEAAICEGGEYEWSVNNTTYTEAGTYDVSETDANGNCISNERLVLTVNQHKATALTDQICLGNGYNANGFVIAATELATAGEYIYTDSLTSYQGCDSIVTLTLTVGDIINNPVEAVACDSYEWTAGDGETYTYTVSGTYNSEAYANALGCTTVDVLTLTINNNSSTAYTETVCDAYMWNGTQYTESGDYTYDYTDGNGCASTDTLHLTINNSVINNVTVTACDSYTWTNGDGETYTVSGVYAYNYTTTDGCNGTDYLVLTVNRSTTSSEDVTACDSYTWNNTLYEQSGTYTFDTTNAVGCDSTATLNLTINASNTGVDVKTACDTYTWIDGNVYTASNNNATYTLTNAAGCDSVVTLNLTINNSVASSFNAESCNSYVWENTYYTASGVYEKTLQAANGCDSVVTMTLVINTTVETSVSETACGSYNWNGITYTASNTYTQTLTAANGCDSVVTLNLTVNQPVANAISASACQSYTWDGTDYTAPGTYTRTYTAANGCDSVVTLTLTQLPAAQLTIAQTACDSYTWHGQTYNASGNYTWTGTATNGCDSVVTLALTVNTSVTGTATATACNSYNWNGNTYTTSGTYTWTGTATNGCDSTVTLTLTVNTPVTATETATACGSYTWHGVTYTTSGTYTWTGTAANGCDSVVTLTLTINQPTSGTESAEACGSYTWHGQTYTASGFYTYSGLTNAAGCDSSATLMLTIKQPVTATVSASACDSYTWNGETYTVSGNYVDTAIAANGCDSITTLVLTINTATTGAFEATACGSFDWNGTVYTNSGTYTQTLSTVNGCDSVVTLTLTVNMPIEVILNETACSSYEWNGQTYTESGTYSVVSTDANGCDSITTLNLTINMPTYSTNTVTAAESYTWNDQTYTESGTYVWNGTNAAGCDSVATLVLTINHYYAVTLTVNDASMGVVQGSGVYLEGVTATVTAAANTGYHFVGWVNGSDTVSNETIYTFTVTGNVILQAVFAQDAPNAIDVTDMSNVTIYSNDTRIFVRGAEGYDVYVYDVNGRVMSSQKKAGEMVEFRMPATGVYLVKVGNAPAKRVLVVR